jgi:hypothetical protein
LMRIISAGITTRGHHATPHHHGPIRPFYDRI